MKFHTKEMEKKRKAAKKRILRKIHRNAENGVKSRSVENEP